MIHGQPSSGWPIDRLLWSGSKTCFRSKQHNEALAESWREASGTLPVTIEVPAMDDIWDAAILKSRFPIAHADAFAAALALKHRCPLVTGDPEFRRVHDLELDWIGGANK